MEVMVYDRLRDARECMDARSIHLFFKPILSGAHIRCAGVHIRRGRAAPFLVSLTVSMLVAEAGHNHPLARPVGYEAVVNRWLTTGCFRG